MHQNKFFGTWSKLFTLERALNSEIQQKYHNDYQAYMKARVEIGGQPVCFDKCVSDVGGSSLSSEEKNCMRECFLKRISARDDLNMLFTQKASREIAKNTRDTYV